VSGNRPLSLPAKVPAGATGGGCTSICLAKFAKAEKNTRFGSLLSCNLFEKRRMPSDRNPVRIEPLISLICYYLKRHELAHALLHKQIDDLWRPRADLEHRDIERMIDKPIKPSSKKKTKFMIDLIIGQGASFIQALPESDGGENPRRLATLFYNALIEENTGIDLGSDPIGQKKAALYDLFGVRPSQISEIQNIDGDYFGYRRSTTRGAIIRYYGANATSDLAGPALPWPNAKRKR
jgi:hypothetical protein